MLAAALPPMTAPIDYPTFAKMFRVNSANWFFSSRVVVSRAKEDIVVNEPQKPTATKSAYCEFKFSVTKKMENKPKIKLPATFTSMIFMGNPQIVRGDSTMR